MHAKSLSFALLPFVANFLYCSPNESRLIVSVSGWPKNATTLRVLPGFTERAKPAPQTFFITPGTAEFSVTIPQNLAGQAIIEGMVRDEAGCYIAGATVRKEFTDSPSEQRVQMILRPYARKQCAEAPQTTPISRSLNRVWADRPDNAWAVGSDRTILRWDGERWVTTDAAAEESLSGIWGSPSGEVWAVGSTRLSVPIARRWDGSEWSDTYARGASSLLAIWGTSDSDIWAVGSPTKVLRWRGTAWDEVSLPILVKNPAFYGVWGTTSDDVWIVGDQGTIIHWNGVSWSPPASLPRIDDNWKWDTKIIQDIRGVDTESVWVVTAGGYGHVLKWKEGNWVVAYDGVQRSTGSLYGIWPVSTSMIWAVGDQRVLNWDGNTWAPIQVSNLKFNGISGYDSNSIWMVGAKGLTPTTDIIYRWDGGRLAEFMR
jgi:hypothetical protein